MGEFGIQLSEQLAQEMSEYFDANWYLQRYPDVLGMDPWEHFRHFGERERRSPGPGFDAEFYARTYLQLEEGHALQHYLSEGRNAGNLPHSTAQSAEQSRQVMEQAIAHATAHATADQRIPIVLVGNDAQRAGAPLLLLEIARHLARRQFSPVVLLLRAGPLRAEFEAIGPTLILDEGYELGGLVAAIPQGTAVLGNTVLSASVLQSLGAVGPRLLVVHEMPDFIKHSGMLDAIRTLPAVAASFPGMTSALTELLPASVRVTTVQPGLLHVSVGPQSTGRVRELIRAHLGTPEHVVIGAGYADARKGFDRFILMAREIHRRVPGSGFIWLGELSEWATALADAAIADGVRLMLPGFRPDAAAWYDNAQLYLLTSRQDPGPTTVIDAARRGTPFVAGPGDLGIHAAQEQLHDVGLFCESDEDAIEATLSRLLEAPELPDVRAKRAATIEALASFPRYVDELLDALAAQTK